MSLGLLLILVLGCEPDVRQPTEPQRTEKQSHIPAEQSTFTDDQTSYTQYGESEDVSYLGAMRFSSRIIVPLGRTREELTATLNRAASELAKETNADAVMVFAYRPKDDTASAYTAGRAIYAPNGDWGSAASEAPMKLTVDLNDLYFAAPTKLIANGDAVILTTSFGSEVGISRKYGSWMDEDILARVPVGTKATILESRSQPMGDQEFVRYRIQTTARGKEISGWVHDYNIDVE